MIATNATPSARPGPLTRPRSPRRRRWAARSGCGSRTSGAVRTTAAGQGRVAAGVGRRGIVGRTARRRTVGGARSWCASAGTAGVASRSPAGRPAGRRCSDARARAWRAPPPSVGEQERAVATAVVARRQVGVGSAVGGGRAPARPCRSSRKDIRRRSGPRRARSGTDAPRKRKNPGDNLFSRKAALSVSSALESLTSVFGMGTGMASPLESPGFVASGRGRQRRARVAGPGGRRKDLRSRG